MSYSDPEPASRITLLFVLSVLHGPRYVIDLWFSLGYVPQFEDARMDTTKYFSKVKRKDEVPYVVFCLNLYFLKSSVLLCRLQFL